MDTAAFQNLISSIPKAPAQSAGTGQSATAPATGAFGLPFTPDAPQAPAAPAPDNSVGGKIANFLGIAGKGIYNGAVKLGNNVIDGVEHPSVLLDRLNNAAPQGDMFQKNEDGTLVLDSNGRPIANAGTMKDFVNKTAGFAGGAAGEEAKTAINAIPAEVSAGATAKTAADQAVAATAHSNFLDELLTPDMNKNATVSAIKTGNVAEGTGFTGTRDFTKAVPGFDNIKAAVTQVPGVTAKNTALENVIEIHKAIGTAANDLRSQLANQEIKPIVTQEQLNGFLTGVKDDISKNPLLVGNAEQTAKRILDHFQSLLPNGTDITGEDVLNARQELDKWIGSLKPNAFDPSTENAVSIALRAVRQGANTLIAEGNPDVAVKQLLAHQTNLYNAIDAIAPKAAKEGSSAFQRIVSTINNNPITSTAVGGGLTALGIDKALKAVTGVGF